MSNVPQDVIDYRERLTNNANDFDSIVADMLAELELLRAQRSNAEPVASTDGEDYLRLSKSGYTLRVGWGDNMRFVAASPKPLHELSSEQQKQWLDDASRLCDGWNRVAPPDAGFAAGMMKAAEKDADRQRNRT